MHDSKFNRLHRFKFQQTRSEASPKLIIVIIKWNEKYLLQSEMQLKVMYTGRCHETLYTRIDQH